MSANENKSKTVQVAVSRWLKLPPWATAKQNPDATFYTVDVIAPPGITAADIATAIERHISDLEGKK